MPSDNHQPASLLIVEDENELRNLIVIALSRAGYRVFDAGNPKEAAVIWEKESLSINLLVADILIPDGSGPQIAMEFRKTRPDLKILFMSGNPRESVVETSHTVRGAQYILKPFSLSALSQSVKAALSSTEGAP